MVVLTKTCIKNLNKKRHHRIQLESIQGVGRFFMGHIYLNLLSKIKWM